MVDTGYLFRDSTVRETSGRSLQVPVCTVLWLPATDLSTGAPHHPGNASRRILQPPTRGGKHQFCLSLSFLLFGLIIGTIAQIRIQKLAFQIHIDTVFCRVEFLIYAIAISEQLSTCTVVFWTVNFPFVFYYLIVNKFPHISYSGSFPSLSQILKSCIPIAGKTIK